MMIRAYNELYLSDAKERLADMFDYAICINKEDSNVFSELFLQSGYAEKFERGNPAIVSGMSGVEIAKAVLRYAYGADAVLKDFELSEERSPEYWAGWTLAEYQWYTCHKFKDIFKRVPLSQIIEMYPLYHEMDISRFIEDFEKRYAAVVTETKLKTIRESRNFSQAELSKISGVKLRSIQMYEQKINDIDKAQAQTLYKLSHVLGCSVEDLLEQPMKK